MPLPPLLLRRSGPAVLILSLALPACSGSPLASLETLLDPADSARRGRIELVVKDRHGQIMDDLTAGGGPALTEALAVAGVAQADRPARTLQLRGNLDLYATSPAALINALALYGA